jgi:hypothetical protein
MANYDMDFPPLEDLAQQDFAQDFFGNLLPPEVMKSSGVALLAGGGGILVASSLVELLGEKLRGMENETVQKLGGPVGRSLMSIILGVAGGRVLWDRVGPHNHAAVAVVAAVGGMGVARLVGMGAEAAGAGDYVSHSLSAVEVENRVPPTEFFSPTRGPVSEGFAQIDVTRDDPLALAAVEVEDDAFSLNGAWLG